MDRFDLIGNVTREPELRYTPNGTAVTTLGLAVNRKYGDKETTFFVDVDFWGKQAETICEYVKTGKQLFVSGRHENDSWEDKETGAKRSKVKFIANDFQFLGKKND